MKRIPRSYGVWLGVVMLFGVMPLPAGADMIQNGSFEDSTYSSVDTWLTLQAGSTAISGWTVIGTAAATDSIDYIGNYWQASDGNRSIDLDGRSARGGLEQIIATEIGHTYRLTFDVAGNTDGNAFGSGLRTMDVLAIGASTQSASFGFDCTGQSHWDMGWMSMEWSFVADAPSTTLRFLSTTTATPAGYGMTLDNVAIHAPAPTAALLALLGLGSSGGLLARCRRRVA